MKSKTSIEKGMQRKRNAKLVKTIIDAKKSESWLEIARILSNPRRKRVNINLEKINKESIQRDIFVIPVKVLSQGEIYKKINVVALNFSKKAKEKLLKSKSEILSIFEEIKKNPQAKGIKILK